VKRSKFTTAVHGHADFDLTQWSSAFKAQHPDVLGDAEGAYDLAVFIELDLD
jgi:hypothetical protein